MRRTTIKDVAALAGVSPATVSRTLDDRPEISAETKERVRAACAQLGYVPNAAAKGLPVPASPVVCRSSWRFDRKKNLSCPFHT